MIRIVEVNYYKLSMLSAVFRSIYFELLGAINRSPQWYVFSEPKPDFSRQYKDNSWIWPYLFVRKAGVDSSILSIGS